MVHETAIVCWGKRAMRKFKVGEKRQIRGRGPKNLNDPRSDESRLAAQRRSDGSSLHFWSSWSVLHFTSSLVHNSLVHNSLLHKSSVHHNGAQ